MKKYFYPILILALTIISLRTEAENCGDFFRMVLGDRYHANFLSQNFSQCIGNYGPNGNDNSATFSLTLRNKETKIDYASPTNIALSAFTTALQLANQASVMSKDMDVTLNTIRYNSQKALVKIDNQIEAMRSTYTQDGLPQIRDNQKAIIQNLQSKSNLITQFNNKAAVLSNKAEDIFNPNVLNSVSNTISDPVENEKAKWNELPNKLPSVIPFHTLNKIYKENRSLGGKILTEVKYARYMEMGLIKKTGLPLLAQVQGYESKANAYRVKYDSYKKTLDQNDQYFQQKKFALTASYELKKIADSKLVQGGFNKANDGLDMATLALEVTTSLPMIATGRGLYEFFTGKSLLTNRDLSNFERGASLSIAFIDLMPAAWIASGFRGAWLVGELGARLVEKGIIKAGFEDALNIGVENAKLISGTFQELLASGSAKLETIKRVIEHKLFFNYLSQETYLASKAFQRDIVSFEIQVAEIVTPGSEITSKLEQEIVAKVKYIDELVIKTPYGVAKQGLTKEALIARSQVENSGQLYRLGTRNLSQTGEGAQFWSLENPRSPDYASRYGIPSENVTNANFIETATVKKDSQFITRIAPPVGSSPGGGVEVVVPEGGVNIESHTSL